MTIDSSRPIVSRCPSGDRRARGKSRPRGPLLGFVLVLLLAVPVVPRAGAAVEPRDLRPTAAELGEAAGTGAVPYAAMARWAEAQLPPPEEAALSRGEGVERVEGLDAVYHRFSAGYRALDAAAVGAQYTADALYLPGRGPIQTGREAIEGGFRRFFETVREEGDRLEIRFEILDRSVSGDLAADVGVFTLRRSGAGGASTSRGKFTVVAVRGQDGTWLFHVDSFSPLPDGE